MKQSRRKNAAWKGIVLPIGILGVALAGFVILAFVTRPSVVNVAECTLSDVATPHTVNTGDGTLAYTAYLDTTFRGAIVSTIPQYLYKGDPIVLQSASGRWFEVGYIRDIYESAVEVCQWRTPKPVSAPAWADQLQP